MNEIFFETIKCKDFETFNLSYHKRRIAKAIGSNLHLEEYLYPPSEELLKCKLIYDKNGILSISYLPYEKRKIHSFKLIFDDMIDYNHKMLNRDLLNNLFLKKEECDDIIIIKNGFITDTSIANIAIFHKDKWITPKSPLLHGTTKARYLDNGLLTEKDITPKMLLKSSKISLLNAMIDFDIISDFIIKGDNNDTFHH